MSSSRTAALRSLRCFRARPTAARPQLRFQFGRRSYASGGHEAKQSGGDAVWAAGAIAITVPSVWYLWPSGEDAHHGGHGDAHSKKHGEEPEEESKDEGEDSKTADAREKAEVKSEGEEKPAESEDKDADSEKSEDSDSEEEGKDANTPDTSDDEGQTNTRKSTPDAKGGNKVRLESNKGIKQGEVAQEGGEGEPSDKVSASKPAGGTNTQSGKQEGLSNTDTKHSLDVSNDPSISKKGEGIPDSAKAKGTVDPKRSQPEGK